MKLSALHDILATSKVADWNLATAEGAGLGERSVYEEEGVDHDRRLHLHRFDEHSHLASYRPDVSFTVAWGRRTPGIDDDESEKADGWAPYPDPDVRPFELDLFWNGVTVDRHLLALVDGGRCILPRPTRQLDRLRDDDNPLGEVKVLGWTTTQWHVDVARLINGLAKSHYIGDDEFDSHMDRSGIIVDPG